MHSLGGSSFVYRLTTQQNMSFGGEIEDLKRKLIYLETREMLESELELLQAEIKNKTLQIKKLESEYQDVITASQKEQTVSTETKTTAPSNEPEKTESSVSALSEVTSWVALDGYCASNKQGFKEISINEITGEFSLFNYYKIPSNPTTSLSLQPDLNW